MFVDASALTSVLLNENDCSLYADRLDRSDFSCITPFVVMETGLAIMRELRGSADAAQSDVTRTLHQFRIETVELTSPMILTALKAHERYGKGRGHLARLNMGDCLSYGAAKVLGLPLLFKGEDFTQTDIVSALA